MVDLLLQTHKVALHRVTSRYIALHRVTSRYIKDKPITQRCFDCLKTPPQYKPRFCFNLSKNGLKI